MGRKLLEITNLAVVSGTSVTITLEEIPLINGIVRTFAFCLTPAQRLLFETSTGIEQVFIQINGTSSPLLTRLGNLFYADRLIFHREYRIAFGNNGLPAGIPHFINFNTPRCTRAYNPADGTVPATPPPT